MTGTLIRKDLRLLRPVVWAALTLGLFFYVIGPAAVYLDWRRTELQHLAELTKQYGPDDYRSASARASAVWQQSRKAADLVGNGAMFMAIVNLLLFTTVAGMAFAVERRERWAELGAMLPVSRRRTVGAKVVASLGVVAGMVAVNVAVLLISARFAGHRNDVFPSADEIRQFNEAVAAGKAHFPSGRLAYLGVRYDVIEGVGLYAAMAIGMAGVAWLLSALTRTATISTSVGVGVAVSAWFFVFLLRDQWEGYRPEYQALQRTMAAVISAAGATCLLAGTAVQLRRRSP